MSIHSKATWLSSAALRPIVLFFMFIFPGTFLPSTIYTLFAIYLPAFVLSYRDGLTFAIVEDKLNVTVKETTETLPGDQDEPDEDVVVAKEIDIREVVTLEEKSTSFLSTILTGLPNPNNLVASVLTFGINLALVAGTVDLVYRTHWSCPSHDLSFVRLGYLSPTEAHFLVREPDQSRLPVLFNVDYSGIFTLVEQTSDGPQAAGVVARTDNSTDYTATVTIPLRDAGQNLVRWRTSNGHLGQFWVPPLPGKMPTHGNGKFTFLSTSCILPFFPYNPTQHALSIPGLRHLASLLPTLNAQFMLFLGDFIYVDGVKRFGVSKEEYRKKYRQVYASPDWPAVGQNLSWIHVLDDHEIDDNWSSNTTGVYDSAVEPYGHYHAAVNPPPVQSDKTYFSFTQGPASFFLLDTRTYRSPNTLPDDNEKTMLGADQLEHFMDWLARPEPRGVKWKIVASSVPFTKNWPVNRLDTWGGFLNERARVLEAMWNAGTRGYGIVVLSGDRHEFAATKFPPPPDSQWPEGVAVHEFSASPLNQFAFPIPTYKQKDNEDVMLKYINMGQSKFGAISIENLDGGDQSSLKYTLFVNGQEAWSHMILSPDPPPPSHEPQKEKSFWSNLF